MIFFLVAHTFGGLVWLGNRWLNCNRDVFIELDQIFVPQVIPHITILIKNLIIIIKKIFGSGAAKKGMVFIERVFIK